jgi:hypothetical protein
MRGILGLLLIQAVFPSCAGKRQPIEVYTSKQKDKIRDDSAFVQADFNFWAAAYEPTPDDLAGLRQTWLEHGAAFPESNTFNQIEREVNRSSQRVVLVALFKTEYSRADLRDKSQGWTVHPVPVSVVELSETDVILRTLMPVANQWARYFMLKYPREIWNQSTSLVVSDRNSRVELPVGPTVTP